MNKEQFDAYVEERYKGQIVWYNKKAMQNQKLFKFWQIIIILTGTLTPILVALDIAKWQVIVISAFAALGTSFLKIFKYQENWINYRTTCETLRKEIYYYQSLNGGYRHADDPEALFIDRVEGLISRENTMWLSTQQTKDKGKGKIKD